MKTFVACLCLSTLLLCLPAVAQDHKYDIKSAIVTFEQTIEMSGFLSKNKVVVYFDDFGMKECKETYADNTLKEVFFSDGKTLWAVKPSQKTAYDRGPSSRGTEMRFDWNEMSPKDIQSGKAKKRPNVKIAGKDCESFQLETDYGLAVYAGWKKITLLLSVDNKGLKSAITAVKVEENVPVPAAKFTVPAGYATKKM
jgi:hypothetical protein